MSIETIEIKTLVDILEKVPEEQLDNFLVDLKDWYKHKKKLEMAEKLFPGIEIEHEKNMLWVNDGKHEPLYDIDIKITNVGGK